MMAIVAVSAGSPPIPQPLYHSQQGDWAVNYAHDPLGRLCREHQPDPRAASAWEGPVPRQSWPSETSSGELRYERQYRGEGKRRPGHQQVWGESDEHRVRLVRRY